MTEEIWKPIKGYENIYEISNFGRIKSLLFKKKRFLKTRIHPSGYELINLKGKTFRVHYLVAQAFIPNFKNYQEINHKDENKQNNKVDNLEWCSRKYNCNYGTLPKKTADRFGKKIAIIDNNGKERLYFSSAMSAERMLKIDHSSIIKCCKGKAKTAGGYQWSYVKER